jgi:hypothetical protein
LLFSSDRAGGGYRFYRMPLGGSAAPESLLDEKGIIHWISYPARMLGFTLISPGDGADVNVVAVAEDGKPTGKPILVARGPKIWPTPPCPRTERSWPMLRPSRVAPRCTSPASPIPAPGAG